VPAPPPRLQGGLGIQTSEPEEPFDEEPGVPIDLAVDERVVLESVSSPVLTFRLERVAFRGTGGPRRELLLEGSCEEQGTPKRCPRATWLRLSDEAGQTPRRTETGETYLDGDPRFSFTASVRASSRRFLITVGDPKSPDVRWLFDPQARKLDVAR
jgi:hypothetical protein